MTDFCSPGFTFDFASKFAHYHPDSCFKKIDNNFLDWFISLIYFNHGIINQIKVKLVSGKHLSPFFDNLLFDNSAGAEMFLICGFSVITDDAFESLDVLW
jgi:hypothetical protein